MKNINSGHSFSEGMDSNDLPADGKMPEPDNLKEVQMLVNYMRKSNAAIALMIEDKKLQGDIVKASELMMGCIRSGGKIMCVGNGGSQADASHFAGELMGKFRKERGAMPAITFTDPVVNTCIANDFGLIKIFSRQVHALGKPEDLLLVLSTSGGSKNVLMAMSRAVMMGIPVIGITGPQKVLDDKIAIKYGYTETAFVQFCSQGVCLQMPSDDVAVIQQTTMMVLHAIVELIEASI